MLVNFSSNFWYCFRFSKLMRFSTNFHTFWGKAGPENTSFTEKEWSTIKEQRRKEKKSLPLSYFIIFVYPVLPFLFPSILDYFLTQLARNYQESSLTMGRHAVPFLTFFGQKDTLQVKYLPSKSQEIWKSPFMTMCRWESKASAKQTLSFPSISNSHWSSLCLTSSWSSAVERRAEEMLPSHEKQRKRNFSPY